MDLVEGLRNLAAASLLATRTEGYSKGLYKMEGLYRKGWGGGRELLTKELIVFQTHTPLGDGNGQGFCHADSFFFLWGGGWGQWRGLI